MSEQLGRTTVEVRLREFYRRLAALPFAASADEAFQRLCETLEAVEDDFSGISKRLPSPPPDMPDGRMYAPQEDFIVRKPDGSIHARTKGHVIEFQPNGGFVIHNVRTGVVDFAKQGLGSE